MKFFASPPWRLGFDAALEARYQADNAKARGRAACLAGLIALLAFNVMLTQEILAGEFAPQAQTRAVLVSHALVTLPLFAFELIMRRRSDPRLRETLLAAAYVLVTIGSVAVNFAIPGEAGVRDAFTNVLIPITCNFALPASFLTALFGSIFCVGALTADCLLRPEFPPMALGSIIPLYIVGAAVTLIANFRIERAERRNYLSVLRESERGTQMRQVNAALAEISRTDFLTGIANRRDFDERFAAAARISRRAQRPLAALMVDVDHFKAYNDLYGHPAGDRCLKTIAGVIAATVKAAGGFVGRYGGEEFAAYLPETGEAGALAVAERLRAAVAAERLPHAAGRCVTISLGAACMSLERPEAAASLLRRADNGLYRAKRLGRNRAEFDAGEPAAAAPQTRSS